MSISPTAILADFDNTTNYHQPWWSEIMLLSICAALYNNRITYFVMVLTILFVCSFAQACLLLDKQWAHKYSSIEFIIFACYHF